MSTTNIRACKVVFIFKGAVLHQSWGKLCIKKWGTYICGLGRVQPFHLHQLGGVPVLCIHGNLCVDGLLHRQWAVILVVSGGLQRQRHGHICTCWPLTIHTSLVHTCWPLTTCTSLVHTCWPLTTCTSLVHTCWPLTTCTSLVHTCRPLTTCTSLVHTCWPLTTCTVLVCSSWPFISHTASVFQCRSLHIHISPVHSCQSVHTGTSLLWLHRPLYSDTGTNLLWPHRPLHSDTGTSLLWPHRPLLSDTGVCRWLEVGLTAFWCWHFWFTVFSQGRVCPKFWGCCGCWASCFHDFGSAWQWCRDSLREGRCHNRCGSDHHWWFRHLCLPPCFTGHFWL